MSSVLEGRYSQGTKECRHCGVPVFSESGRKTTCLGCKRDSARKRMGRWIEKNKETHRARSAASYRPRARFKANATAAVYRAVQRGALVRMPCEVCGNKQADAHHDDYSKPLDVRWLCRAHHAEFHRKGAA